MSDIEVYIAVRRIHCFNAKLRDNSDLIHFADYTTPIMACKQQISTIKLKTCDFLITTGAAAVFDAVFGYIKTFPLNQ